MLPKCKIAGCDETVKKPIKLIKPKAGPSSRVVYTVCEQHWKTSQLREIVKK